MHIYDSPIVVGLRGLAGSGKTVTADTIVPNARIETVSEGTSWDHMFFAMPLYSLVSIKRKTQGYDATNRQSHLIHQELYNLFKPSELPGYNTMVELVQWIEDYPLPDGQKPRSFMQDVGTRLREINIDCFTQYIRYRILETFGTFRWQAHEEEEPIRNLAVVVSDVRYPNEVGVIKSFPQGVVVQLECDEDIRQQRLYNRDGHVLSAKEASHSSEHALEDVPADITIDTTHLTIPEQAEQVKELVRKYLEEQ